MREYKNIPIGNTSCNILYIDEITEANVVLKSIEKSYPEDCSDLIGIDIETAPLDEKYTTHGKAGLDPALSQVCSLQLYLPKSNTTAVFNLYKMGIGLSSFKEFIETRKLVAHNAQFEMQHFLHNGIVPKNLGCSMLLFRLLLHAIHDQPGKIKTNLASLGKVSTGDIPDKDEQTSNWASDNLTWSQIHYAGKDAALTYIGAVWCMNKIAEYDLKEIVRCYKLNKDAQLGISQMSLSGISIDTEIHDELIKEWQSEYDEASEKLYKMLPEDLNLRSPKQLSDWLKEELSSSEEGQEMLDVWPVSEKTNNLKCDAETLGLFDHLPIVEPLLKYKKLGKLISTYGPTLQNCISPVTKRIHSSFTQCHTGTGRMSSFGPNIQNIPRSSDLRKIFKAEKDNVYIGADFGQIEVRVAAHLSEDSTMLEAFEKGIDLYRLTAASLLNKDIDEVTKDERQTQKAIVLGSLFGLGAKTMQKYARNSYGVDMSASEAKQHIQGFRRTYPELYDWQMRTTNEASQCYFSVTEGGKIRRLPKEDYYSKSLNTPVQGTAAEIILRSIVICDKLIRKTGIKAFIVNVVHDEIIIECHKENIDVCKEILKVAMEQAMLEFFPTATLNGLVDVGVGNTWEDCKV